MIRQRLCATTMWAAALGLAGLCLGHGAMAASPACSTYNVALNPATGQYVGNVALAYGLTEAIGGALVLGVQATEYPGGALYGAITEPVCQLGIAISSNGNPTQSFFNSVLMLPETDTKVHWNGRFLGLGNGGFAGPLVTASGPSSAVETVVVGVAEGYAAATTDLGTATLFNCNSVFCGSQEGVAYFPNQKPGGLYGDAAALTDFGYGATHLMTLAAKYLVTNYYGQAPNYNYFHGCSTGGQQALMEAQRFPTDYDGILAGSPAYDRTHLHIGAAALYEATHFAPDAYLTNEALGLVHSAMLAQCAGTDGGLATDDFLTQPARCTFAPSALTCSNPATDVPCTDPNGTSCTCLTPNQTTAMTAVWTGALDNLGRTLYPGYERGAEEPVALSAANGYTGNLGLPWQQSGSEPAFDSLDYWAFGASFNWTTLFANTTSPQGELFKQIFALDDTPVGSSTMAGVLNANSTDLSAFSANGGKLIMYAGYADPLIPSASSIDYYNNLTAQHPGATGYAKLFLAPGMWHCNGGPGANVFGNLSSNLPPVPTLFTDDILGALTAWRENTLIPSQLTATKYVNDTPPAIAFQRPICAYPNVAIHKPKKDGTLASSYSCIPRIEVHNQKFNELYGPN